MSEMKWYAGRSQHFYSLSGHHHAHLEDGTKITVHPDIYDQQFDAYLERIGVKPTSWYEIMCKAEAEWQAYCRVMEAFAGNVEQWLEYQGRGVVIERPKFSPERPPARAIICKSFASLAREQEPRQLFILPNPNRIVILKVL